MSWQENMLKQKTGSNAMSPSRVLMLAAIFATLAACAPLKPHTTLPVTLIKSPNLDRKSVV